jgi:phospholipase/carboxylesterase
MERAAEVSSGGVLSRRGFVETGLAALGALAVAPALAGCGDGASDPGPDGPVSDPRLTARPGVPTLAAISGTTALGLSEGRDGLLFVPDTYSPDSPAPLVVALHGAGGGAGDWEGHAALAAERGIVVLAPDSRFGSWDLITVDYYGPDVDFLDQALAHVFERVRVDPSRLSLVGFSDGASYALSLGLSNGDLFPRLVGHSAGFLAPGEPIVGRPRVWMSHGTSDAVLPVSAGREVEQRLRSDGYDVTFTEFDGGHGIPPAIAADALEWLLGAG